VYALTRHRRVRGFIEPILSHGFPLADVEEVSGNAWMNGFGLNAGCRINFNIPITLRPDLRGEFGIGLLTSDVSYWSQISTGFAVEFGRKFYGFVRPGISYETVSLDHSTGGVMADEYWTAERGSAGFCLGFGAGGRFSSKIGMNLFLNFNFPVNPHRVEIESYEMGFPVFSTKESDMTFTFSLSLNINLA
jgi:hypothetical protein